MASSNNSYQEYDSSADVDQALRGVVETILNSKDLDTEEAVGVLEAIAHETRYVYDAKALGCVVNENGYRFHGL